MLVSHRALRNYTANGSACWAKSFFIPSLIMKAREYCCCAIPLVNAGIYITLIEHTFVSLLVGILSVATPSSEYYNFGYLRSICWLYKFQVVGASTPSFASALLAVFCFVVTAVQPLGFIGVTKVGSIYFTWQAIDNVTSAGKNYFV